VKQYSRYILHSEYFKPPIRHIPRCKRNCDSATPPLLAAFNVSGRLDIGDTWLNDTLCQRRKVRRTSLVAPRPLVETWCSKSPSAQPQLGTTFVLFLTGYPPVLIQHFFDSLSMRACVPPLRRVVFTHRHLVQALTLLHAVVTAMHRRTMQLLEVVELLDASCMTMQPP